MRHELAEVGNDRRGRFTDSHAGGDIAFFVPDGPGADHGVLAIEVFQRSQILIDEAFGAIAAGRFQVLPGLVQGDICALAPEQWLPDPGKQLTGTVEAGLQQVRMPGIELP